MSLWEMILFFFAAIASGVIVVCAIPWELLERDEEPTCTGIDILERKDP